MDAKTYIMLAKLLEKTMKEHASNLDEKKIVQSIAVNIAAYVNEHTIMSGEQFVVASRCREEDM